MKYRTKPFEIEAVQWKGYNVSEIKNFVGKNEFGEDAFLLPDEILGVWDDPHVWDYLQKTWVTVNDNDYIIKGMRGEFYPCAADVFEAKYEPAFATGGRLEGPSKIVLDRDHVIPVRNIKEFKEEIDFKELTDDNEE